jgi:hypothetical protein
MSAKQSLSSSTAAIFFLLTLHLDQFDVIWMTTPNPSLLYVPWYFTLGSFENVFTSRIINLGPTDHPACSLQQLSTGQNTPKYLLHGDVFRESK